MLLHELYLTTQPVKYAIEAQDKVIKEIASHGSCVIVGRASDYVLRESKDLVRVFIYAPKEYRTQKVMEMYKDTKEEAAKNIEKSDKNRASYYKMISGESWGEERKLRFMYRFFYRTRSYSRNYLCLCK